MAGDDSYVYPPTPYDATGPLASHHAHTPGTGSAEEDEDEMCEPRREGSFEMGYNANTEGMGYDQVTTSSFDQAYLEVSLCRINRLIHMSLIITGLSLARVFRLILSTTYGLPCDASHGVNWTNSKTPPPPIPVPIPASSSSTLTEYESRTPKFNRP
jgi:hypothetical protein